MLPLQRNLENFKSYNYYGEQNDKAHAVRRGLIVSIVVVVFQSQLQMDSMKLTPLSLRETKRGLKITQYDQGGHKTAVR